MGGSGSVQRVMGQLATLVYGPWPTSEWSQPGKPACFRRWQVCLSLSLSLSLYTYIHIYCYVYSLPLCYFTQSALPKYQTGCCSVLHVLLCPAKRIRRAAYLFAHL